jgi:hypothetical protein
MEGRDWYHLYQLLVEMMDTVCSRMSQVGIYRAVLTRTIKWKKFVEHISYDQFTSGCWDSFGLPPMRMSTTTFYDERKVLDKNQVVSFYLKNKKTYYYIDSDRIVLVALHSMIRLNQTDCKRYDELRKLWEILEEELGEVREERGDMKLSEVITKVPEKTVSRKKKEKVKIPKTFNVQGLHELMIKVGREEGVSVPPTLYEGDTEFYHKELGVMKAMTAMMSSTELIAFIHVAFRNWYKVLDYMRYEGTPLHSNHVDMLEFCFHRERIYTFLKREGYLNAAIRVSLD